MAGTTRSPEEGVDRRKIAAAYRARAENEDWLDANIDLADLR